MKWNKLFLLGITITFIGIFANLRQYFEYKDFVSFWEFQEIYFKLGTWYNIFIIIGIILLIIYFTIYLTKKKYNITDKNKKAIRNNIPIKKQEKKYREDIEQAIDDGLIPR